MITLGILLGAKVELDCKVNKTVVKLNKTFFKRLSLYQRGN